MKNIDTQKTIFPSEYFSGVLDNGKVAFNIQIVIP